MVASDIKACLFDVFGTVVDWRTSVTRDLQEFARRKGIGGVDWLEFAVEWRKLYQPAMDEVRSGRRAFTILDVLHRESLGRWSSAIASRGCRRRTSTTSAAPGTGSIRGPTWSRASRG